MVLLRADLAQMQTRRHGDTSSCRCPRLEGQSKKDRHRRGSSVAGSSDRFCWRSLNVV